MWTPVGMALRMRILHTHTHTHTHTHMHARALAASIKFECDYTYLRTLHPCTHPLYYIRHMQALSLLAKRTNNIITVFENIVCNNCSVAQLSF